MKTLAQHFRWLALVLVLATFSAPLHATNSSETNSPEVWMNVFVHGITSIKYHLSIQNIVNLWRDRVFCTRYETAINLVREDDFMYQAQPMQDLGLHPINTNIIAPGYGAAAFANVYEMVDKQYRTVPTTNLYYTFGWSAVLSLQERFKAAETFYKELKTEIARLKNQHPNLKLRIFGFSHGGNVSLKLAQSYDNDCTPERLSIDELFLVACPVQIESDFFVNSPLFKKVYHFYSLGDRVQKIEPFSFNRIMSRNHFARRKHFILPDKLTQVSIKIMRNTCLKKETEERRALRYNFDNPAILKGTSYLLRDMSASHSEVWFFGWTPTHYRPHFALYPLPLAVFIPRFKALVDNLATKPQTPVLLDVRPEQDAIVVRNCDERQVCPFFGTQEMNDLKNFALRYKPDCDYCNLESFNCRIKTSQEIATRIHKEKRRLIRRGHHPHEATKKANERYNRTASHN